MVVKTAAEREMKASKGETPKNPKNTRGGQKTKKGNPVPRKAMPQNRDKSGSSPSPGPLAEDSFNLPSQLLP